MDEPVITSNFIEEDMDAEYSLRPQTLREYIGQAAMKESMEITIGAAKKRGEAMDHVLLYGPPGLGKTTFAGVIANELGVGFRVTSGPAIAHGGELAAVLTNLSPGDVLFIDEIHRLNTAVEEVLYPAMEDFVLDIMMGKGPGARSIRMDLPRFTLIGATTKAGLLSGPLRDRFGIISRLLLYTPEELERIILRSADILRVETDREGAAEIALRSRGTPRIANRLLRRARDYAQMKANGSVTAEVARQTLRMLGVDDLGLDHVDRRILLAIIEKYGGGPVGLDTIAATTGEETATIEDLYEPYLLQMGFLARTPRGRVATPRAYAHLGLTEPVGRIPSGQTLSEQASPEQTLSEQLAFEREE